VAELVAECGRYWNDWEGNVSEKTQFNY